MEDSSKPSFEGNNSIFEGSRVISSSNRSKKINLEEETCSNSRFGRSKSLGFIGRWNLFYNSITGSLKSEESNTFTFDAVVKKVKRSENVFTKIKRFYRSLTEEEQPVESDHSEPSEVILDEPKSDFQIEPTPREVDNELLRSFSSLSVQIRNEELNKIHDALKRYRDKETRLTEKLLKTDYKVLDYDYFPKAGDKDHDLWDLKTKLFEDDTLEYLKVLFFRDFGGLGDSQNRIYSMEEIQSSLNKVNHSDGILVDRFGIEINKSNISCLFDTNWLNDEIINFYLQILQEHNDKLRNNYDLPSCFFFNTFFFQALCGNDVPGVLYDYKSVARWTKRKKVNIFEKDLLIVPVHVSKVHWALGVVDMRSGWKRIMIFDSLGGTNPIWFKNIKRWLQDEHMDKMNAKLTDIDEWKVPRNFESEPYAPSQQNSYDCGLFLCQFAKCISFAKSFNFTTESSSYLRNMMIHEILSCKIQV